MGEQYSLALAPVSQTMQQTAKPTGGLRAGLAALLASPCCGWRALRLLNGLVGLAGAVSRAAKPQHADRMLL